MRIETKRNKGNKGNKISKRNNKSKKKKWDNKSRKQQREKGILRYKILYDPSLNLSQKEKKYIKHKIIRTLSSPKGWKRIGYRFKYISSGIMNEKYLSNRHDTDFIITITSNQYILDICNFDGLSCADMKEKIIYLNIDRWNGGSIASGMDLDNYRTYVINHEVGHILDRNHYTCHKKGDNSPVMVQQTIGLQGCKPNPYPLYWE